MVKVDRAYGVALEVKGHVLLNVYASTFVCVFVVVSQRRDGERERSAVFWLSSLCGWAHSLSPLKTGLFTVQQASVLGDYTKPSTEQFSTSKKLQLFKVLLGCLCRLSEGRADLVDSSRIAVCLYLNQAKKSGAEELNSTNQISANILVFSVILSLSLSLPLSLSP